MIGIAASHAPNLANPLLMTGVKEVQYAAVKAGFAEARALLEQARPDAIVIFSTDHFDRCFYDNLPPFLMAVGEEAEGPANEWLKIPRAKLRVAGELGRFLVSERLEQGVDFTSSADLPLDQAGVRERVPREPVCALSWRGRAPRTVGRPVLDNDRRPLRAVRGVWSARDTWGRWARPHYSLQRKARCLMVATACSAGVAPMAATRAPL